MLQAENFSLLELVFSSVAVSTIIVSVKELVIWRLNRKAHLSDQDRQEQLEDDESHENLTSQINSLHDQINESNNAIAGINENLKLLGSKLDASCESDRVLLHDKLQFLLRKHITEGSVSVADKQAIREMWKVYHNEYIGGNGDLKEIYNLFNELPINL